MPKHLTHEQVAWAAGFFDGEGTVSFTKGGGEGIFLCAVCSTNFAVIDRLHRWFNGRTYVTQGGRNQRPVKRWVVSSRQARWFATLIRPHVFVKAKQLDLLLRFYNEKETRRGSWYLNGSEVRRRERLVTKLRVLNQRGLQCVEDTRRP